MIKSNAFVLFAAIVLTVVSCEKQEMPNKAPKINSIKVNGIHYENNDSSHFEAGDTILVELLVTDDKGVLYGDLNASIGGYYRGDSLVSRALLSGNKPIDDLVFKYVVPQAVGFKNYIELTFYAYDIEKKQAKLAHHFLLIEPETTPYSIEIKGARVYNPYSDNIDNISWDIIKDIPSTENWSALTTYGSQIIYNEFSSILLDDMFTWPYGFLPIIYTDTEDGLAKAFTNFNYETASEYTTNKAHYVTTLSFNPGGYDLVVGDVIIGKWKRNVNWDPYNYYKGDRYFIIKITDIVKTAFNNDDYIEFSYKKDLR